MYQCLKCLEFPPDFGFVEVVIGVCVQDSFPELFGILVFVRIYGVHGCIRFEFGLGLPI
jgi:hypothetical protein